MFECLQNYSGGKIVFKYLLSLLDICEISLRHVTSSQNSSPHNIKHSDLVFFLCCPTALKKKHLCFSFHQNNNLLNRHLCFYNNNLLNRHLCFYNNNLLNMQTSTPLNTCYCLMQWLYQIIFGYCIISFKIKKHCVSPSVVVGYSRRSFHNAILTARDIVEQQWTKPTVVLVTDLSI